MKYLPFLLLAACAHSASDIPPTAPARPATPTTQCRGMEQTALNCATAKGKRLSVCVSGERLQYRFGPPGAPELVFPPDAEVEGSVARFRPESGFRINGAAYWDLVFDNGGYSYDVYYQDGTGGGEEVGGVVVKKDGKDVATVACTGDIEADGQLLPAALRPKITP